MQKRDTRPTAYQYLANLRKHLGNDLGQIFNGKAVYPRQMEVHLPANHIKPCNFTCYHCQGQELERSLAPYEQEALELMDKIGGKIPFYIFSGAYSEPLMNPYLMSFLMLTKKHGSHFGIHTNGSLLKTLQQHQGWLTELTRIATDPNDYLSVSLDAGRTKSHQIIKNLKTDWFSEIIRGIEMAVKIRGRNKKPAIRVCYLLNRINSSKEELTEIINIMKKIKVDSLRFSIPHVIYGKNFKAQKEYRDHVEKVEDTRYISLLGPLVSKRANEKPFIFYLPPDFQDVEKMCFKQCIYSYYQITLGADGYFYRCSSTATPSFKFNRLGRVTGNLKDFRKIILKNHNPAFDPTKCFSSGARCTRMALEINWEWLTSRP